MNFTFLEFVDNKELIEKIKKFLYVNEGYDDWESFVDNQKIGECQYIVDVIVKKFKNAEKIFGEIEIEEPYVDEYGDEQNLMTHHWIEIDGIPYDFSKGTLKQYINFENIYNPEVEDESIYKKL